MSPINPMCLPRWARRLFVLTLPISGPLWIVWAVTFSAIALTVAALFCAGALIAASIGELWAGRRTSMGEGAK